MWWWVVMLSVAASGPGAAYETSTNKSEKLVEKLRRQLMQDNYDYMYSDEEPATTSAAAHARANPLDEDQQILTRTQDHTAASIDRILRVFDKENLVETVSKIMNMVNSRNGSVYKEDGRRTEEITNSTAMVEDDTDNVTSTTRGHDGVKFKYKMLKMKRGESNRRRGEPYRRFIQEQGDNGVVIIRLDDGPFPEFRLPKHRRQYMLADGEISDPGAVLEGADAVVSDASEQFKIQSPISTSLEIGDLDSESKLN